MGSEIVWEGGYIRGGNVPVPLGSMKLRRRSTGNGAAIESREIASNRRAFVLYRRLIAAVSNSPTFTAALVSAGAEHSAPQHVLCNIYQLNNATVDRSRLCHCLLIPKPPRYQLNRQFRSDILLNQQFAVFAYSFSRCDILLFICEFLKFCHLRPSTALLSYRRRSVRFPFRGHICKTKQERPPVTMEHYLEVNWHG